MMFPNLLPDSKLPKNIRNRLAEKKNLTFLLGYRKNVLSMCPQKVTKERYSMTTIHQL